MFKHRRFTKRDRATAPQTGRLHPFVARRGVVVVEAAVTLSALMLLILAILDIGLAVARFNMLSAAAKQTARAAIVRGGDASPELSSWGPSSYLGTAADQTEIAAAAAPFLAAVPAADVVMALDWPDGDNQEGSRVHVRLTYVHQLVPFLGATALNLNAESVMRISR